MGVKGLHTNYDTKNLLRYCQHYIIVVVRLCQLTHLAFDVCELGEHEGQVEGQLSYVVIVLARTQRLQEEQSHTMTNQSNILLLN